MATITLTADTLISTLMPSGGGSLASGDNIQLAGHSLIVDADAVDYPVTIANSGGDANLELRDLGRIKLNATLPANVHPWIDPAHPLPVAAEPGIDGDPYRTPLTANARAEIQLNGADFSLGGGAASLQTETRVGAFFAEVASSSDSTHLTFTEDISLHAGDVLVLLSGSYNQRYKVVVADYADRTATFSSSLGKRDGGDIWAIVAGGIVVNRLVSANTQQTWISSPTIAGTLNLFAQFSNSTSYIGISDASIVADRLTWFPSSNSDFGRECFASQAYFNIKQLSCVRILAQTTASPVAPNRGVVSGEVGELASDIIAYAQNSKGGQGGRLTIHKARLCHDWGNYVCSGIDVSAGKSNYSIVANDSFSSATVGGLTTLTSGTITSNGLAYYHSPATSADVTWRYTDRTVPPGATLRFRCAWRREGSSATRASVAITDTATWWPQLWPLGAEALASVEFTGGTVVWRSELLAWRNTGTEAATVRVWECVTGTVGGGYLKVEEVKGGAL